MSFRAIDANGNELKTQRELRKAVEFQVIVNGEIIHRWYTK